MEYCQSDPMLSSDRGMARLNGSNRAAWNAMDLQIGERMPSVTARGAPEDNGALSARNVLLRQKLRERKRYDSADDAMKKAAARAANQSQNQNPMPTQTLSPAQVGQSAFFNAMESDNKRNVHRNVPTALYEAPGNAVDGRNVLIQRKLQSKTSFDSADYQMAKAQRSQQDTTMEDWNEECKDTAVGSPCASSLTNTRRRQEFTSMSPSRAGKYGTLGVMSSEQDLDKQIDNCAVAEQLEGSKYGKLSAAHVLIRRKLKERKRFDSADYAMEKQGQPTDVPADIAANPATPGTALRYGTLGSSQSSINHQVKHIKLSEDTNGRVGSTRQPVVANAAQAALAARAARYAGLKGTNNSSLSTSSSNSQAAFDRYGLDKSMGPSEAVAARNLVLQRKLAERK